MDINAAFPSNYLKAADLQGREVTVTILHVTMEDIGSDHKPVAYFVGKEKGIVLNKTNANAIAEQYGGDTDMWLNKPITLFPSQTDFQGRIVPCIRVKLQAAVAQPAQTAQPETDQYSDLNDNIPF